MATYSWLSSPVHNGDFNAGANWSSSHVPVAGDVGLIINGAPTLNAASLVGVRLNLINSTAEFTLRDATIDSASAIDIVGSKGQNDTTNLYFNNNVTNAGTLSVRTTLGTFQSLNITQGTPVGGAPDTPHFTNLGTMDVGLYGKLNFYHDILGATFNNAASGLISVHDTGVFSTISNTVESSSMVNNGTILITGSTTSVNSPAIASLVTGSGTVLIQGAVSAFAGYDADFSASYTNASFSKPVSGQSFELRNGAIYFTNSATADSIAFQDANGMLSLGTLTGHSYGLTVSGFRAGDVISVAAAQVDSVTYDPASHLLTLSKSGAQMAQLTMVGDYAAGDFTLIKSNQEVVVACYRAGTRLLTARGEIPVETLRVGDLMATAAGLAPVRWLGHRRIAAALHPNPAAVWPVRIAAGAFAPGLPHRDLWLSPDHAVFTDGVLVPARLLVNGVTILRVPCAEVEYWHVELPAHAILLAEGLPAESYLDSGNRAAFANGGVLARVYAEFPAPTQAAWRDACATLLLGGRQLATIRTRLLGRAGELGHALTDDPAFQVLADGVPLNAHATGAGLQFDLPPGTGSLRLRSRRAIPRQTLAAGADDRSLGVAVVGLELDGIAIQPSGAGWHTPEAEWQWTDGDAEIACTGARVLKLTLAHGLLDYWSEQAATRAAAR